ncbi:hypothetical protein F3J18_34045 [Burkholderia sp. Ax-1720]|nr:hypothetical protein [Burkholderia sp. Ax-1720]
MRIGLLQVGARLVHLGQGLSAAQAHRGDLHGRQHLAGAHRVADLRPHRGERHAVGGRGDLHRLERRDAAAGQDAARPAASIGRDRGDAQRGGRLGRAGRAGGRVGLGHGPGRAAGGAGQCQHQHRGVSKGKIHGVSVVPPCLPS